MNMKATFCLREVLQFILPAAAVVMFTGCAGVAPVPVTNHVAYGQRLESKNLPCIQPGRTTRAQVIAALGTNYAKFGRSRSIAYTWEMRGGGGVWWVALVFGEAAVVKGNTWVGGWRGFLVAFDERDVVRAAEFKKLSCRISLDENLDRWVAKLPPVSRLKGGTSPEVAISPISKSSQPQYDQRSP